MSLRTRAIGAFVVALALAGGACFLSDPVSAQTEEGAAFFAKDCARCHGDSLEGGDGPPLAGPGNMLATYGTADALLRYAMENMPNDQPATLSPAEYASVIGFILSKHGVAVPEGGLTAENAASITIP